MSRSIYQNAFALAFLAVGIGYELMALSMPVGGFANPGPGLYPIIVGAALILTSAACLIQNLVSGVPDRVLADDVGAPAQKGEIRRAWLLVAALIAYVIALKPLGFPVALPLLLMASVRVFGETNWLRNFAVSVVLTAIAYAVFIVWLKVPLPMGILGALLE